MCGFSVCKYECVRECVCVCVYVSDLMHVGHVCAARQTISDQLHL